MCISGTNSIVVIGLLDGDVIIIDNGKYPTDIHFHTYANLTTSVAVKLKNADLGSDTQKEAFKKKYPHAVFAIGEGCNANAFELAFALIRYEFAVAEVFGNLSKEDFVYIEKMAKLSPETKIYSNLEPTMIYYEPGENPVDIVIGKDAVYYHPEAAQLEWSDDIQPFGYRGVKHFFEECERVLELERGTN